MSVQFISDMDELKIVSVCEQVLKKTFFIDYLITKNY